MSKPDCVDEVTISNILDYYGADVTCWNCDEQIHRYIRKRIPKERITTECDECGCINRMSGGK